MRPINADVLRKKIETMREIAWIRMMDTPMKKEDGSINGTHMMYATEFAERTWFLQEIIDMQIIDAIPISWLEEQQAKQYPGSERELIIRWLIEDWRKHETD